MSGGRALILAGTGMLSEVAETLVRGGWHVVLPSRRYSPMSVPEPLVDAVPGVAALRALGPPGHVRQSSGTGGPGRARWVEARWDRPGELAEKAEGALDGPADLLVAWVDGQYRPEVMDAVDRLLAPDAPVVEVRASGEMSGGVEPSLAAHPTQMLLLGRMSEQDGKRGLSHGEIVDGVQTAVRRALGGEPASVHQIGRLHPVIP